jgi:hypothetical protein
MQLNFESVLVSAQSPNQLNHRIGAQFRIAGAIAVGPGFHSTSPQIINRA